MQETLRCEPQKVCGSSWVWHTAEPPRIVEENKKREERIQREKRRERNGTDKNEGRK